MAASLSTATVKDGNGAAISGGVRAIDESGSGSGPFKPASAIIDGGSVSGAAAVDSTGQLSVNPKLQMTPVAPASATATKGALGGVQYNATTVAPTDGQQFCVQAGPAGGQTIEGPSAHGATIAGNPVRRGSRGVSSNPAAVTSGQTVDQIATLVGAAIIKPYSIPEADWSYAAAGSGIANTTTAVTIKTAAGAGLRNYITSLDVASDALTNATEIAIRDGAAGTVIWRSKIGTAGWLTGRSFHFVNPIKSSANTLLEFVTLTASGAGAVYVNAQGYVAP
jgi:hypothetical protein